jgi:hypothetical protein
VGGALCAAFLQNGFLFTVEPVKPKLSNIGLKRGMKKIFSLNAVVEFVKGILKLLIVGSVVGAVIWPDRTKLMAIPAMLAAGYKKDLAAGCVCAGGSLGTTIPPSVVIIIYASITEQSVGDLFAGIMIPAMAMVGMFIIYILGRCIIQPDAGPGLPASDSTASLAEKLWFALTAFMPAAFLVTAVLGSIFAGVASPTEAAAVGSAGSIVLTALYGRLTPSVLFQALKRTIMITSMVMMIVVGGVMFASVFIVIGGDELIGQLDWVTKRFLLRSYQEKKGVTWGDPRIAMMDLQYHDMREDRGLYHLLERQGRVERLTTDEDIEDAMHKPPEGTRAYFRGQCLMRYRDEVYGVNWASISFNLGGTEPIKRIIMAEPLRGTRAHVEGLLNASGSAHDLVKNITQ